MLFVVDAGTVIFMTEDDASALRYFNDRRLCYKPERQDNVRIYRAIDVTEFA